MKLINGIGYLNKKEVIDGIKKLPNAQDKFIILAIYNGIAGKNYKHLKWIVTLEKLQKKHWKK